MPLPAALAKKTGQQKPESDAPKAEAKLRWSTTEELGKTNGIKVLVYGPAGAGKTMLCASAPNPIIISAENGMLSLRRPNLIRVYGEERAKLIPETIPVIQVRTGLEFLKALEWCKHNAKKQGFETVCVDSASEIAESMLATAKSAKTDGRQAYGEVADIVAERVRYARDQLDGLNVVIVTKMESIKDGVSGGMYWGPSFPGQKLGPASAYWLDETFYLGIGEDADTKENYRYLQTGRNQQYDGKDRSGALDFWEAADLSNIFAKITGDLS